MTSAFGNYPSRAGAAGAPPPIQPNLERFTVVQDRGIPDLGATTFGHAMKELGQGKKTTHWMWYVFPQALGLSLSRLGAAYAIESVAEARSYLAHPVLGRRLKDATQAVLDCGKTDVHAIFGSPDDEKFKSCLTLFSLAEEDGFFKNAAQKFWPDVDGRTLDIWQKFPDYAPPKPANPPAPISVPADGGNDQGEEGNDEGKDDGNNGGQGSNKESNGDDTIEDDDDDIEDYLPHDMFDPDNMQPEGEVWEVVRIRASKICMGMLQYQVDWKTGTWSMRRMRNGTLRRTSRAQHQSWTSSTPRTPRSPGRPSGLAYGKRPLPKA